MVAGFAEVIDREESLVAEVGFEPTSGIENTYVVDFRMRQKLRNRQKWYYAVQFCTISDTERRLP